MYIGKPVHSVADYFIRFLVRALHGVDDLAFDLALRSIRKLERDVVHYLYLWLPIFFFCVTVGEILWCGV